MQKTFYLLAFSILITFNFAFAKDNLVDYKVSNNKNNFQETLRLEAFNKLIKNNKNKSLVYKLVAVNTFFNQMKYKTDIELWGKNDYWAKPLEFLKKGAGDCEDYALAKLYALKKLGISQNKFKLYYSKIKKNEKPHMVLAFYYKENKEPLILDNFNKKIFTTTKRNDLEYIYAFNTIMLNK